MRSPNLTFGPYNFDPNSRLLSRGGTELPLPPRVIGVLEVLLRRAGDVVSRHELIESVWKDAFVTDTSLGEAVSALRQALGDDPQTPVYVQTLHRRGYRFVAPVAPVLEAPPPAPAPAERRTAPVVAAPTILGVLMPWSVASICAVAAAVALWHWASATSTSDAPIARFAIPLAAGTRLDGRSGAIALAPDARAMVWSGCDADACRLYVRRLDRIEPEVIAGTEGAASPFVSPDGQWVGFFAGGQLKKVALAGGAPVPLTDAPDALGGVWLHQGAIVYGHSEFGGLLRVPADGGEPSPLTAPRSDRGETAHAWPALSPRGDLLLFTILTAPGARTGRVGAMRLDARGMGSGWQTLGSGISTSAAPADDVLLLARGDELQAAWFDHRRLSMAGSPPSVASAVASAAIGAQFAVSRSGALLVAEPTDAPGESLVWLQGSTPGQVPELDRPLQMLTLAPDGSLAAGVEEIDGTRSDVWVADLSRGTTTRITHGGENTSPVWAGQSVVYASRVNGAFEIWQRDRDAAAPARRVHASAHDSFPIAATADGALAFLQADRGQPPDIWLMDAAGDRDEPLIRTPFAERGAAFSPDGAFIAYESSEAGRWDVYVLRLADSKRTVVSRSGGNRPVWAPDGRSLYYHTGREIVRIPFDGRGDLRFGMAERAAGGRENVLIGVAPDGRMLVRRAPAAPASVVLALEWVRELRHLLGPPPAFLPR